ncbi:uncharacterized protein [Apostichopus japonicus]|uniref:uncharacterized protein n=1 Tax=Stichopus japonicus TaxID=307972 RepID=UPI003AB2049E
MSSSARENESKVTEDNPVLPDRGTPYRLPSLSAPQQPLKVDDGDKILLSLPTVRLDLHSLKGSSALKTHPPYTAGQLKRAQAIHAPKFSRAHFAPEISSSLPQLGTRSSDRLISPDVQQISISKKITARSAPSLEQTTNRWPVRPAANRRLVWKLSPHPHRNYDAQSLKGTMGPYSREFVVHCTTPKTWLRMKLSKSL